MAEPTNVAAAILLVERGTGGRVRLEAERVVLLDDRGTPLAMLLRDGGEFVQRVADEVEKRVARLLIEHDICREARRLGVLP